MTLDLIIYLFFILLLYYYASERAVIKSRRKDRSMDPPLGVCCTLHQLQDDTTLQRPMQEKDIYKATVGASWLLQHIPSIQEMMQFS
jgi:hypothetical protein